MLFNSWVFVLFFAIVYSLYLLLQGRLKWQNAMLLIASYIFYGYWDWRFLLLMGGTCVMDYLASHAIHNTEDPRRRKELLLISVVLNLGILGVFKYFNFFAGSFAAMLTKAGIHADYVTLNIVLPVGISFYTFQSMSYSVDVYRRQLTPASNLWNYLLYVSFFPQLVAGPIERASHLLPQVERPRTILPDQVNAGLFLVLWGFFKKVVIADNMAVIVDKVFHTQNYTQYAGMDILVAILAFAIQIYGDFSGYSDIARGLGKMMGFDIMVNFKLPYFAVNPRDFWDRWHISLSTWLRDYLYIPLGGNRGGRLKTYRNLTLTMVLGGLWHGAAWTFVIWGAIHGGALVIHRWFTEGKPKDDGAPASPYLEFAVRLLKMALMFAVVCFAWIPFRAKSFDQWAYILTHAGLQISPDTKLFAYDLLFFALPLLLVQALQYRTNDLLVLTKLKLPLRVPVYSLMIVWILAFGIRESMSFIYFQF